MSFRDRRPARGGVRLAQAAFVVGLLFAAVSAYWASGGVWLLDTIGGSLEAAGRAGGPSVLVLVWAAVVLKVIGAVLPSVAVRAPGGRRYRAVRALAWIEACILTTYGSIYTVVGLLVQTHVLQASADADERALAWHTYLWDPWFLVWGLLVTAALLASRPRRGDSRR